MKFKKRLVNRQKSRYNEGTTQIKLPAAKLGGITLPFETIIMLVVMFVLLYFMMIRPENKRKREAQALRESLTVGDEITSIGGITGTICAVKENTIVFETGADRVRIEMAKWAVSSKSAQAPEPTK